MANSLDEIIDFRQILFKIIKNWFWILLSLLVALTIAFAYNRYSTELFRSETSILIKEDNSLITASDLLYDQRYSSKKSLENKELMIKSYPLIYKTLQDLSFNIAYFIEGNIKGTETYDAPIILICVNTIPLEGKVLKVHIIDDDRFAIIDVFNQKEKIQQFNEKFLWNGVEISIEYNVNFPIDQGIDFPVTIVKFYSLQSLTLSYQNKILVEQKQRESTVIKISILTEDEKKGVKFLNKLTDNFILNEVSEKNLASNNTVKFINAQLNQMSDSLALIEQRIQEYKNTRIQ